MFEFETTLPGPALLKLQVKDWDRFTPDDDLGFTTIDLEHRYYCDQWRSQELKPIEERKLQSRNRRRRRQAQAIEDRNGTLKLWVDIHEQREHVALPPPVDITKPPPEAFQLRVIVWSAEEMKDDKGRSASGTHDAINDLYFSGHLRTTVNKQVREQEQQTDTHWRAKEGKGEFNYRLLFDFEVDPQLPVKRPCSFTLKAWDKDVLKSDDLLGFKEIELGDMLQQAMRDAIESKKRQQVVEDLMKNGRLGEMEETLNKFQEDNRQRAAWDQMESAERKYKRVEKDKEGQPGGVFGMVTAKDEGCCAGCSWSRFKEEADLLLAEDGPDVDIENHIAASEMHATAKYRFEHERKWVMRDLRGKRKGIVWVSLELLHSVAAAQRPAGIGRSEPNLNPTLEDPEREELSLLKPFAALRFFVGPARMKRAKWFVMIAMTLAVVWAMVPSILSGIVSKFIATIPAFAGPVPCDPGYAKAAALYTEFCGPLEAPFQPKISHWLDCLGPEVNVCNCSNEFNEQSQQYDCEFVAAECSKTEASDITGRTNRKCANGMHDALAKPPMAHMSPAQQRALVNQRCTDGGAAYLLAHYDLVCQRSW